MPISQDYANYVLEQLARLGRVSLKKMFGGACLFMNNKAFGLIADDVFYLKVDETNRADYERLGSGPFQPFADKKMTMNYYEVPIDILEDRDAIVIWAKKSIEIACRGGSGTARKTGTARKGKIR
jgi:DNA transformation protein and related proteins